MKMKGMGGHMDAALITEARNIRKHYEQRAAIHDAIAREIDNPPEEIKRFGAQVAIATGNLAALFDMALSEVLGIKKESKEAKDHRNKAKWLREKAEHRVALIRERLKDRGVYNVTL